MAESLKHIAAGIGAVVVIMVVGGPGEAISAADPGGHRHHVHTRAAESADGSSHGRGQPGSGRSEPRGHDRNPATPVAAGRPAALPDNAATPQLAAAPRAAAGPMAIGPAPSASPIEAVVPARRGNSSISRGRAQIPRTVPNVTFGDGRSPGVPAERAARAPAEIAPTPADAPPDAPPQAPAAASIEWAPAPPERGEPIPPETPPTAFAGPFVGSRETGWPAGVLFGIAGLILAPIGGVWLGHRQARAMKSASHLVSR